MSTAGDYGNLQAFVTKTGEKCRLRIDIFGIQFLLTIPAEAVGKPDVEFVHEEKFDSRPLPVVLPNVLA